MRRPGIRTVAGALVAVWAVSIVSFVLLRLAPGDPVGLVLGPFATDEARDELSAQMGIDDPLMSQYWDYVAGTLRGDWGYSYSAGVEVKDLLLQRLPASVELSLAALCVAIFGAIVLSTMRATARRSTPRRIIDGVFVSALAVPQFWLGLVLLVVFSQELGVLPGPEGRLSPAVPAPPHRTGLYTVDALAAGQYGVFVDAAVHLVIPGVALGAYMMGFLGRLLTISMERESSRLYVLTSRTRGVGQRTAIVRHALPNGLLGVLPAFGTTVGLLVTGTVLVENVVAWPGVGASVTDAIRKQDYAPVQAFVLFSAVIFVLTSAITDFMEKRLDPRSRNRKQAKTKSPNHLETGR